MSAQEFNDQKINLWLPVSWYHIVFQDEKLSLGNSVVAAYGMRIKI